MRISERIGKQPLAAALAVILSVQIGLIFFSNLLLMDQNVDCDSGKLFRHIVEMWENKTYFVPGWAYTTSMVLDATPFFAVPLYGLTKNVFLACAISNLLFLVIFLAVIFYLFRDKDIVYPIFCANIICLPYGVGMLDYYNMLFFAITYYIVRVTTPLLAVALLLAMEKESAERRRTGTTVAFVFLYFGFLMLTSISCNVYSAACGLFPAFAIYLCYKFFRWEKVPVSALLLMGCSVVCVLLGAAVNLVQMGDSRAESMSFCSIYQMLANVSYAFFGMFELMGGTTGPTYDPIAIFSLKGVLILVKICMTLLFLICGAAALVKCIRKRGDLRLIMLLAIFGWNYFILNISNVRAGSPTSEYRYHLMGMIPLMCVTGTILLDTLKKFSRQQQRVLCGMGVAFLLVFGALTFRELYSRGEQNADLKELCAYCSERDVDMVYMYRASNDSDICRALDTSGQYICLLDGAVTWTYHYYKKYVEGPIQPDHAIVAVNDEEYQMGETFEIGGYRLEYFDTAGGRSLYRFVLE